MAAETMPTGNFVLRIAGYQQSLLQELYEMKKQGCLCDVSLITRDGKTEAHRVVLIAASSYLRDRLNSVLSDEQQIVQLTQVTLPVLMCVVEFMYTGILKMSYETVEPVMNFCEQLGLSEAATMCHEFLVEKKNPVNENTSIAASAENINAGQVDSSAQSKSSSSNDTIKLCTKNRRVRRKPCKRIISEDEKKENNVLVPADDTLAKRQNGVKGSDSTSVAPKVPKLSITIGKPSTRSNCKMSRSDEKPSPKKRSRKSVNEDRNVQKEADMEKLRGKQTDRKIVSEKKRKDQANNKTKVGMENDFVNYDDDDTDDTDDEDFMEDADTSETPTVTETNVSLTSINSVTSKTKQKKRKYPINCEICDETIPNHKMNLEHKKLHNTSLPRGKKKEKPENWPCCVCKRILTSAVRHACHLYSKHGIPYDERFKLYKCDEQGCTYITASKHYLQIHQKGRHGNERPHVCEFCGKGFKLPSALITHLNIHTNQKVFQCPDCDQTFNQKGGLDIHIKKRHKGMASWTELCHLCSEKFLQKADLCWHMYKSHQIPLPDRYKMFSCELCNYQTIRKNKLERHMEAHNGTRSWTCEVCSKKFATKSYLKRHVKYHGEKTFKCSFENCSYACVDQVGLNKHVRLMHTHKNFKPYKCSLCPYKSGLRGNLDKHIRSVHNLDVVTKHTVHLKMKFRDRKSGDVLTKDGHLVHTLQKNSDSGINVQDRVCSTEDEDEDYDRKPFEKSQRDDHAESTTYLERKVAEQMVAIGQQMQASAQQEVPDHQGISPDVDPSQHPGNREYIQGYVYQTPQGTMVHTSQGQAPFNMVSNEIRMSLAAAAVAGQMGQGEMYNIDPMGYITSKFSEYY